MADIKRLLTLITMNRSGKILLGIYAVLSLFPVIMAFVSDEPGLFYSSVLFVSMSIMTAVSALQQVEFPGFVRSSPHRKSIITKALPKVYFVMELCGALYLIATILFAARRFPELANRTVFVWTIFYLVMQFFFSIAIPPQHKVSGKSSVIYMMLYLPPMMLVLWSPMILGFAFGDRSLSLFTAAPDYPLAGTLLILVAGSVLNAFVFSVMTDIAYPHSIGQKHLDRLE